MRLKSSKGQALVPALALIVIASAVFFFVFNSGRAVNEKINLVNAADAAAYSGAQVVARNLNFMAYTNRAMIANEVAIGHMYSFQIEMDLIGEIFTEGLSNSGFLGSVIDWLIGLLLPTLYDIFQNFVNEIVEGSRLISSFMMLLYDSNNAKFASYQQQAYLSLIQSDPNTNMTGLDQTIKVVAEAYLNQSGSSVLELNNEDVYLAFADSDDPVITQSIVDARTMQDQICHLVLFASPSNSSSSTASNSGATCDSLVNSYFPEEGEASLASDSGMLLDAINQTVQSMDDATWIRDRNVAGYESALGTTGNRSGSTEVVYDEARGQLNWQTTGDHLDLKYGALTIFSSDITSGNAATSVDASVDLVNNSLTWLLSLLGVCGSGSCEDIIGAEYNSIERYAALNPDYETAKITAFLRAGNCSDGIGFDDSGKEIDNWNNNFSFLEDEKPYCGDYIYAISQAEVYYQRPLCYDTSNGAACDDAAIGFAQIGSGGVEAEKPNLFNPFWQVRLIPTGGI